MSLKKKVIAAVEKMKDSDGIEELFEALSETDEMISLSGHVDGETGDVIDPSKGFNFNLLCSDRTTADYILGKL